MVRKLMKNSKIKLLFKQVNDWLNTYLLAAVMLAFVIGDGLVCLFGLSVKLFLPMLILGSVFTVLALVCKKFKIFLLTAFCLGCFWCGVYTAELNSFPYAEGRAVEISGKVTEVVAGKQNYLKDISAIEKEDEDHTNFILEGTTTEGWTGKVLVSAYGYQIKKGDEIHLIGNVKDNKDLQNPYVNSNKNYLRDLGASAYLQAMTGELQITAMEQVNPATKYIDKLKQKIYFQMEELPEKQRQLLCGLAFGDKTLMTNYDSNVLSQTGIAHVFAVSGLHVGFVIAFVMALINLINLKFRLPKILQLALVSVFTLFYAMMCGFAFSVIRSVVMGLLSVAAIIYYENYSAKSALVYAAFICVLLEPYALCNIGFQLSFLATFALLFTYNLWKFLVKSSAFATVFSAQFMTMPLVAYYFNVLTLSGLIISPLVTFLAGFVVIFAFLAMLFTVVGFGSFFLFIAGLVTEIIYKISLWASGLPGSWLTVCKLPVWAVVLYYILLALAYYFLSDFAKDQKVERENRMPKTKITQTCEMPK